MGNSSTKEQRPPAFHAPSGSARYRSPDPSSDDGGTGSLFPQSRNSPPPYGGQGRRGSRPDLIFPWHGPVPEQNAGWEPRRETKQERDARRAERARVVRLAEREHSMREESVDGGYLVTQGVYTGIEDFNKGIVRQLMIERRVAPFFKGLNDHSESWTDNQLIAVVHGLPLPNPDDPPLPSAVDIPTSRTDLSDREPPRLSIVTPGPSPLQGSDPSPSTSPAHPASSLPPPSSPIGSSSTSSASPFRPRSKTLASLTSLSKQPQGDMTPREINLPKDPFVEGRPIEAWLYRDAIECPICFLYYPPYLNKTRCCDQPICSECFVQIKRPDPHLPEHHGDGPGASETPAMDAPVEDGGFVSEPATCPFCKVPEFGITFEPPSFRRGLSYASPSRYHALAKAASPMSSSSSLSSNPGNSASNGNLPSPTFGSRRRTISISANDNTVVTTDRIRPDWAQKLATARAHAARRSAAATALHTAAYLIGNGTGAEGRGFGGHGRRARLLGSRSLGGEAGSGMPGPFAVGNGNPLDPTDDSQASPLARADMSSYRLNVAEAAGNPNRRSRMDDLEDMMMMEAIRLSLASEEERRKKEEKEAKKETKRKDKENKKAEKASRKHPYGGGNSESSVTVGDVPGSGSSSVMEGNSPSDKGKGIDRFVDHSRRDTTPWPNAHGPSAPVNVPGSSLDADPMSGVSSLPDHSQASRGLLQPSHAYSAQSGSAEHYRPSHLRHVSNTSSSASSFVDSGPGSLRNGLHGSSSSFEPSPNGSGFNLGRNDDGNRSSTPPGGSAGTEPMFNFRSLAAMIGDEETWADGEQDKHAEGGNEVVHTHSKSNISSEGRHDYSQGGKTADSSTTAVDTSHLERAGN